MKQVLLASALFFSLNTLAQLGCTDPVANNYDAGATENDGSCTYDPTTIAPTVSFDLDNQIRETSGLVNWDGVLYTHNDDGDRNFYSVEPTNGTHQFALDFSIVPQVDWEEFSQDDAYFYIGDFGNNANGNREDLRIYRVEKASLLGGMIAVDTIEFSYPEQTDFSGSGSNNTDFDCEAMVIGADSIYLFTKEWVSMSTSVYALPKTAGTHSANLKDNFAVSGLITGATAVLQDSLVVLCGYNDQFDPFFLCLYGFSGDDFFGANKRVLSFPAQFHQVEAISTSFGLTYHVTNEGFTLGQIDIPARIHTFDFTPILDHYYNPSSASLKEVALNTQLVYPNPSVDYLTLKGGFSSAIRYEIFTLTGQQVADGILDNSKTKIDIKSLPMGNYMLLINGKEQHSFTKIDKNK